jgi:hypothetical protein
MRIILAALAFAGAAQAQTVVYDTFNEADQANLFDCCNVLSLVGAHVKDVDKVAYAIPFSPEAYAKITEVDVALSGNTEGVDREIGISITGSTMGLPGKVKKMWTRMALSPGQCCEYVAVTSGQATQAAAGGHYWIEIHAKSGSMGGWNLNTIGASGSLHASLLHLHTSPAAIMPSTTASRVGAVTLRAMSAASASVGWMPSESMSSHPGRLRT